MGYYLNSSLLNWGSVSPQSLLTSIFWNVGFIHRPETVVKSKHLMRRQQTKCKYTHLTPVHTHIIQNNLIFPSMSLSVVQAHAYVEYYNMLPSTKSAGILGNPLGFRWSQALYCLKKMQRHNCLHKSAHVFVIVAGTKWINKSGSVLPRRNSSTQSPLSLRKQGHRVQACSCPQHWI